MSDSKPVSTKKRKKSNTCLESNKPMHTRVGIRFFVRASYKLSQIFHRHYFKNIPILAYLLEKLSRMGIWKTNNTASIYEAEK